MGIIVLLLAISCIVVGGFSFDHHRDKKALAAKTAPEAVKSKSGPDLSEASKRLLKEYNELPLESRPFDNITDLLHSLDVTLEDETGFDVHFDGNYDFRENSMSYSYDMYDDFQFDWHAHTVYRSGNRYFSACDHKDCAFRPYYDLHLEIERVKQSLADKQKALDEAARAVVVSSHAHNVAMVDELIKSLRAEVGIQKTAAQKIKEIS